ncbi:hypothetical protein D910_08514 [Dendroctonus ponderosae]|uniref:mRNA-decapping enzyme C-terminal domain-containing protein n=3 Tax=Dendroctonus ponderosae TaxID=77166 RepID=U4UME1_DENPD|nr:hypothetical protein D910_08514 [Dendroctonus ponderosae]
MADSIELRASLNSLKRVDPYVKSILATATQVALYKFNVPQNVWEKADKEGALFLYSRNGEPFHSIMIFNRLNKDNFIEPIIKDFDYQVQLPFLLYRSKTKIFGIWFFNREECTRVASLIQSLMDKGKVEERSLGPNNHSNGQSNVDIFSMLSKAQENFNKTPSKSEGSASTFLASTPRVPDIASQSVMDFFAKASTKNVVQKPVATGENVLQRLMSNPAHSVEHIEKQQRSITPQELASYRGEMSADRSSVPIKIASSSCPVRSFELTRSALDVPRLSPPKQNVTSSPLTFLMQSQISHQQSDESNDLLSSSPFQQFLENAQKPLLMTPMMFTAASSSKNASDHNATEEGEPVAMLTEKQLAQALIYLLKHNADFVKQIHQAYTNSILEKVDKSRDRNLL